MPTFHVLADEHGIAARLQAGAVELYDVAVVVQALQDAHLLQGATKIIKAAIPTLPLRACSCCHAQSDAACRPCWATGLPLYCTL
jgi:hypothetical protein